jgi:peptidoglycan/xylan/chitin deacetylase (PgdA/CDA1 family)
VPAAIFSRRRRRGQAVSGKKRLFFPQPHLRAFTSIMFTRFAIFPLVFLLSLTGCNRTATLVSSAEAASPPPAASAATAAPASGAAGVKPAGAPAAAPATKGGKVVVDQTAQTIIFCYHRFVDKLKNPWTEIKTADFEAQMKALKDHGITVIGMQDFLAWRRGEKNIPARSAIITFDDGWKSQYEVAWPIMKKLGYPLTLFIYTEGVRGGHFGGGEAMTWEQLADMRDNGVDIQAHSATHQDLRKGYDAIAKKKTTGEEYEKWLQNEVAGCKQLLEQRLALKINCFAVPFGNYNDHVKEMARNSGYEAMFTVYGQPLTYTSPMDALGRYAIEGNKPKVFDAAMKTIATSSGGASAVAEVGAANLATQPADGDTVRTSLPLIKANLSSVGSIDPNSVQMRVSGLGVVPATYDPKTGMVTYQVTQKLRDKTCTVILTAKAGDKKVEARWTFGIEDSGAPAASPAPVKK